MNNNNLASKAIQAALSGNWSEAIKLNLAILKKLPEDIEALLRLAKAYEEVGEIKLAKKTYRKVIKIDKFNPIAKRGLKKLSAWKTSEKKRVSRKKQKLQAIKSDLFLEEPGKTKTVSLIKLAPPEILLKLDTAEEVKLAVGKHSISVRDKQNNYLGRLPDDLSQRLIKLINGGNQYLAVVKAVDQKMLKIFIKEIKQSKRNASLPSFPSLGEQYHAFLPKEAIKEKA